MQPWKLQIQVEYIDGTEFDTILDRDQFCASERVSAKAYVRDESLVIVGDGQFCIRLRCGRKQIHKVDVLPIY